MSGNQREIRADFDRDSIVVYQAYSDAIAEPALRAQTFVAPFSFTRMTWIKPSFLWLMERSNWARKPGQQHILAVRLSRTGWEQALRAATLTNYEPKIHGSGDEWRTEFERAPVHVQWDTERTIRGAPLAIDSIQVGIGRGLIETFATDWVQSISDLTARTRKVAALLERGDAARAKEHLPREKPYPVAASLARRLGMSL